MSRSALPAWGRQLLADQTATGFSCLILCHLPHLHLFFLWFFHYDCTVLKSYNSPYRIAPAASKLTIQRSILINFLSHVLWPAMGGIFQILT